MHEQHKRHKIRVPFPGSGPDKDAKYSLAYSKPTNINVVGSYGRRTSIHTGNLLTIDLAVTMPSDIFQDKDYLNYRYFDKRAFYLACLASGITEAEECSFKISFALQDSHDLQPVIMVQPGAGEDDFSKAMCQIRIILAAHADLFPISKTLPTKNSVRPKVEGQVLQTGTYVPTPLYNSILRSECASSAYLKLLHAASLQSDGFASACMLGSVWIRQRVLAEGGFGSFEWACMMALLLQSGGPKGRPLLSKGYSSYQLFKAFLQILAVRDLVAEPCFLHCDASEIVRDGRPIVFDGLRQMNVLFKMNQWSYETLRHEAHRTLRLLSDALVDQFDACFITKVDDPVQRYDGVAILASGIPDMSKSTKVDAVSDQDIYHSQLYEVLRQGLSDRVNLITISRPAGTVWDVFASKPSCNSPKRICIGLMYNPEQLGRTVDRGPSAEDKIAAIAFRKFWGDRAELRRFKDGSIQETVTWSQSASPSAILKQIITYIVQRHIDDAAAEGITIVGEDMDELVQSRLASSSSAVAHCRPIMDSFESLEKSIRSLQGLPLQIRQISAADPSLRFASVVAPISGSGDGQKDPIDALVQFEGSSRWPDDLIAVQRTKIAFLLKMGELLEESTPGLTARVGLENTDRPLLNAAFLDTVYPNGTFFRIRIHHEREQNLLEHNLKTLSHPTFNREDIAFALSTYKRDFTQAPLHTQAVRTLSTRFALLSSTMRMVKLWRDSHLLSHHISDELIELLTIRTFVHPHPWSVPGSVMTGFLRTLTFLSKWDWRNAPLIIDFNGEMDTHDIETIKTRFEAWRRIDPAMNRVTMFVASNVDREGITWTQGNPMKVVAARLTGLARAASRMVREQGLDLQIRPLFIPSLTEYDFVLHLNSKFAGNRARRDKKSSVFKNLQNQTSEDHEMIGFNPIQCFITELKRVYKNNVLFFHNASEGSVIGGLWNPQAGPRAWKINIPYTTAPRIATMNGETEAQVEISKEGTLNEIARLGGDLISHIEV